MSNATTEIDDTIVPPRHLTNVRYEIRGPLARRALEMERAGREVIKLNIGNPAAFGFRTPESMRRAVVENLADSEGYCHQKGIFPAREAVVMENQNKGVHGVTVDDVFMGNGVSELILMSMEALLEPGDEVLLPAPDYPLWTAAVVITGAKPVYYHCRPDHGFAPDPEEIAKLVSPRTRALVMINPNNPTGAVYPRAIVEALVRIAEANRLVLFSDEIYDQILYDGAEHVPVATLCHDTLCATFGGLSKVYRACGFRVGWLTFSGRKSHATQYLQAIELLASLRLCSNVPGQWAIQTALGGYQSINDLVGDGGRLRRQRDLAYELITAIPGVSCVKPSAALYMFPKLDPKIYPIEDDRQFFLELLRETKVMLVQGTGFNWATPDHFRIVFLPHEDDLREAIHRIAKFLELYRLRSKTD